MSKFYVYFIFFLLASHSYLLNTCNAGGKADNECEVAFLKAVPNENRSIDWFQKKLVESRNDMHKIINDNVECQIRHGHLISPNVALFTATQQEFTDDKIKYYLDHIKNEISQIYPNINQSQNKNMQEMMVNLHLLFFMTTIFMKVSFTRLSDSFVFCNKDQFIKNLDEKKKEIKKEFETSVKNLDDSLKLKSDDLTKILMLTTYAVGNKINSFASAYDENSFNTNSEVATKEFDEYHKLVVGYEPKNTNAQEYKKLIDLCFGKADSAFENVLSIIERVRKGMRGMQRTYYPFKTTEERKDQAKKEILAKLMKHLTDDATKEILAKLMKHLTDDATKEILAKLMKHLTDDATEEVEIVPHVSTIYEMDASDKALSVLIELAVVLSQGTTKSLTDIMGLVVLLAKHSADISLTYYNQKSAHYFLTYYNQAIGKEQAQAFGKEIERAWNAAQDEILEFIALLTKDFADIVLANKHEAKKDLLARLMKTLAVTKETGLEILTATDAALATINELGATDKALFTLTEFLVVFLLECSRFSEIVLEILSNNHDTNKDPLAKLMEYFGLTEEARDETMKFAVKFAPVWSQRSDILSALLTNNAQAKKDRLTMQMKNLQLQMQMR